MEAIKIDALPDELMQAFEHDPTIIMQPILNGTEAMNKYFKVGFARDKATYTNAEIFDAVRVAGPDFAPVNALTLGVRKVQLEDFDIDLTLSRETLKGWVRSYLGDITGMNREKPLIEAQGFPAFMLQQIIGRQFGFMYLMGAWKGERAVNGKKAEKSVTGLLEKLTIGRASGGDIPTSNVHTAAVITVANAYEEVNAVAELIKTNNSELLGRALECRMSPELYIMYKRNRQALFPTHLSPTDNPTALDDFSNITLVQEPGLAGKQTVLITDPNMLRLTTNESVGDYAMSMERKVKSWDFNLHFSLCFDYAYGKLIYLNDKV